MIKKLLRVAKRIVIKVFVVVVLGLAGAKAYQMLRDIPITYHLAVIGEIDYSYETRFEFAYMSFILRTLADENDTVIIYVDSPGGLVYLGYDLVHDIEFSFARTISWTPKFAASMGAQIAFATDQIHFTPTTMFVFHRPFAVVDGEMVRDDRNPVMAYADSFTYRMVFKFLTLQQEAGYIGNQDVYVTGAQITAEAIRNATK